VVTTVQIYRDNRVLAEGAAHDGDWKREATALYNAKLVGSGEPPRTLAVIHSERSSAAAWCVQFGYPFADGRVTEIDPIVFVRVSTLSPEAPSNYVPRAE
jgi:hypothetical protein